MLFLKSAAGSVQTDITSGAFTLATSKASTDFTTGPLYKKLVEVLPAYTKDPFGEAPELNVAKLISAVEKSHEAVYKWLRKSRLTPSNAQQIVALANRADNLKALTSLGRTPPTREDFLQFVFVGA